MALSAGFESRKYARACSSWISPGRGVLDGAAGEGCEAVCDAGDVPATPVEWESSGMEAGASARVAFAFGVCADGTGGADTPEVSEVLLLPD